MGILRIKVRNCNNIVDGEIDIDRNKLNIFFGRNGTGKSTIAKAILLGSEDKSLSGLTPYGIDGKEKAPGISGVPSGNIAIFNTDYVKQYIFQPGSLIKEPFEILIRSQSYDKIKEKMDQTLAKIKSTITDTEEITVFCKYFFPVLGGGDIFLDGLGRQTKALPVSQWTHCT